MINNVFKKISIRIWVVGVIFSITSFIILADIGKEYKSELTILIIPKSQIVVGQVDNIVQNISNFPKLLSFYKKLLSNNAELEDRFSGFSADQKKKMWNDNVEIEIIGGEGNGSMVVITAYGKTKSEAVLYARKTVGTLLEVVSKYYDIKNDIDIRIIDGPITSAVFKGVGYLIFFSIFIGFILALALDSILSSSGKVFKGGKDFTTKKATSLRSILKTKLKNQKTNNENEDGTRHISYDTSDYQKERRQDEFSKHLDSKKTIDVEEFRVVHNRIQEDDYPNFPEMPTRDSGRGDAPNNLPVAESAMQFGKTEESLSRRKDDVAETNEITQVSKEISEKDGNEEKTKKGEPTEKEIRDRLNKLLNGDL